MKRYLIGQHPVDTDKITRPVVATVFWPHADRNIDMTGWRNTKHITTEIYLPGFPESFESVMMNCRPYTVQPELGGYPPSRIEILTERLAKILGADRVSYELVAYENLSDYEMPR